ncbi:MAG TPA: hypothetical protein VK957_19170 [Lunatimonas sp.]|nr:hypothetical protein [Lunatimonas sp.]
MYIPFKEMPANSRIWVYQSDRPFDTSEINWIQSHLSSFCEGWNTHGQGMPTSFDIMYDQFILLGVDEKDLGPSGCSIDSSVRIIRSIEEKTGVSLLDSGKVSFLSEEKVTVNKLADIRQSISKGILQPETPIFNPIISTKSDLAEKWIIPAKDSWLKRYFNN